MLGFLGNLFSGGTTKVLGEVAKEWITTDIESAEAKSLFVKTLDPNGKMRRDLSIFASKAYGFYLVNAVILIYLASFGIADKASMEAATMMKELFLPITTAWGGIVGASFGINGINSSKGV